MNAIEIDNEALEELSRRATGFYVTPNDVIRNLLGLPQKEMGQSKSKPFEQPGASKSTSNKTLIVFINGEDFQRCHKAVDRFLLILAWLSANQPEQFVNTAFGFQRGKRVYFGKSQEEVENSGGGISAKLIPKSTIWVLVTLDNRSKRLVIEEILRALGYAPGDINLVLAELPDSGISRRHASGPAVGF